MLRRVAMMLGLVSVCLAATAAVAAAQGPTATLRGVILDENGAAIPGVALTARQAATGLQRSVTGADGGTFVIPLLPPGVYALLATRDGFTPAEVRELTLNVGDDLSVTIRLKVAAIGEEVTVAANATRVNTAPGISTSIDQQFVKSLPLNGRSFQRLILLSPGVVPVNNTYGGGEFSINGQRSNANYFTIDGVSANVSVSGYGGGIGHQMDGSTPAATADGGTNTLVSLEAIQEFKIQTSTFAPEFGRMPGGQIGITTRSGANVYHGSGSFYLRDDAMDATDWFVKAKGLGKPPLSLWDAGGTLGGPLRAQRLFFFSSYEELRLDRPAVAITDVPSRAVRAAAAPGLREVLNAFPQPTGPDQPNGLAEFGAAYTNPSQSRAFSLRLDGVIGATSWFARYSTGPSSASERNRGGSWSANTRVDTESRIDSVTGGMTRTWASFLVNDLRVNYTRSTGSTFYAQDDLGGAVVPAYQLPTGYGTARYYFRTNPAGRGTVILDGIIADNLTAQANIVDTLSLARGSHQFKLGVDYRQMMPTLLPLQYDLTTQIDLPRVSSGIVPSVTLANGTIPRYPRLHNLSLFAQDTWQARPRLTVTYGVRYELNPPPGEREGNDAYTMLGIEDPATATFAPRGTPLWETRYANIAPRVGVAYQLVDTPGRETVLRAGAGLFHDLNSGQSMRGYEFAYPFNVSRRQTEVPFPFSAEALTPATEAAPPYAAAGVDPRLKTPVTRQWNVAIERAFGSAQTASVAYVGAAGRDLTRMVVFVSPSPTFSQIDYLSNGSSSDYHALQAQFRRRLSASWQASAAYTWSKAIDTESRDNTRGPDSTRIDPANERGPADFDIRHSLTAAVTWLMPEGGGRRLGALAPLVDGWSVDAIVVARSAPPMTVLTGDAMFQRAGFQRPNVVPGVPFYLDDPAAPGGRRLNPAAFSKPDVDRMGDLGRNAVRGFGAFQLDLAVRRRVRLWQALSAQVGIELFNVTNRPNFDTPEARLSSVQFGRAVQTLASGLGAGRNPLYQLGGPRSVQLSLKVEF